MAGYAVECALKACIAKTFSEHGWPDKRFVNDCHTHNLSTLLRLAELDGLLAAETSTKPELGLSWTVVKDWNEQSRYERHSQLEARELIDAVTDNANGVLPWIKARW